MKKMLTVLLLTVIMSTGCVIRDDTVEVPYKPMMKDEYNKAVQESKINIKYSDYQMESFKKENGIKDAVCVNDDIIVYDNVNLDYLSDKYNIIYGDDINKDKTVFIQENQDAEEVCDLIEESTAVGCEGSDRILPVTYYIRSKASTAPLKFVTVNNLLDIINKP